MSLEDREILLGKLALGRSLLARPDALSAVEAKAAAERAGRPEALAATLVRLGLLRPSQVRDLEEVVQRGWVACRKCTQRYALARLTKAGAERCGSCGGGPLFVQPLQAGQESPPLTASGGRLSPETDAPQLGGSTFLELDAVEAQVEVPSPGGEAEPDFRAERTLELDMPHLPSPGGEAEPDFRAERTLELDMPHLPSPIPDPIPDFRSERTLQLDMPNLSPPTGEPDYRSERTLELEPGDFGRPGPELDVGATTALPPGWVQDVVSALPSGGGEEVTQELDPAALARAQEAAFEPFIVGAGVRIVAPIARGGMGVVFRGQAAEGQVVAVKILVDRGSQSPEVAERFRREAVLTQGLDHPNIVKMLGAGLVEEGPFAGSPYFTMDYIAGHDLAAWARERSRAPREAARMLIPICEALNYAHGLGVVHRDLKPANVLVRARDEVPFLCDFGLAKLRSTSLTGTGDILGTPSYMAPEQARGQGALIGPPTDVHALGALLYFLITGRAPFVAPKPFEILRQVAQDAPTSPRELNSEVSPELEAIVLKALQKRPTDRYHTCAELAEALRRL